MGVLLSGLRVSHRIGSNCFAVGKGYGIARGKVGAWRIASNEVFPYTNKFTFNGQEVDSSCVLKLLGPFLSAERQATIAEVARSRTFCVVPVIEGIYDTGNISAVLRSADALGFGSVHCIKKRSDKYKMSQRCSAGADKWLDFHVWEDTRECLMSFKRRGFSIVTTHMTKSSVEIQNIDWTKPTAVVLGNEGEGVSELAVDMSDACAIIPMEGFVESFNISVAAALILYEAKRSRIQKLGRHGDLSPEQQEILQAVLSLQSKKEGVVIVEELLKRCVT